MTVQETVNTPVPSMAVSQSTIAGLLDSLPNSEDPVATLSDLKTALFSLHPSALKDVVGNMSFNLVFQFLNTTNREQVKVCCDVLDRLLSVLEVHVLLENFMTELNAGLHHQLPEVSLICLAQILRVSKENPVALCSFKILMSDVIRLLASDNMELSREGGKIIVPLAYSSESLHEFFNGSLVNDLREVMNQSDVIRYRVYELIVDICNVSPESLKLCTNSGLLQQLLNEIYKDDILVQLNALELLKELALCEHGLLFLEEQGILGKLHEMLTSAQTDPMAGFLLPGLVKFFGTVARLHPAEVCQNYPAFITMVFDLLDSQDLSLKCVAIETLGFIGKPVDGKLILCKQGNRMTSCLQTLGSSLKHDTSDIRIKTMTAVASLLHSETNHQTEEISTITESWYRSLIPKTMETLMALCQQPFLELHLHAFSIIKSMALLPWGQRELNNHPGFNEYLLDRSTERTKEGKEIKYDIVKVLIESPTAAEIFGQPYFMRLRSYAKEGPFYVQAQSEVAFEGSS